jgi:hypothetical protein
MAHTETPANPSPSIIYFTLLWIPGGWGTRASLTPRFHSTPRPKRVPSSPTTLNPTFARRLPATLPKTLAVKLSPLGATLTKIMGGAPPSPCFPFIPYSLLTTHYSLPQSIGYTIPLGQP